MLQQTQVQTVLPYYRRFTKQFPRLENLARADVQTVLKLWEGLGYYSRARNLHQAAKKVDAEMDGRIPSCWEALRSLPGIGDYIASAVLSIAFNQPHAVVDGNVKRVLARLFMMDTAVNLSTGHKQFQAAAQQLLDSENPGDHNQAMMELGALVCTPRQPDCGSCPLKSLCLARKAGAAHQYPKRNKRPPTPVRRMVVGVVLKKGRILLTRRPDQGLLGGMWEFAGGPVEPGDDLAEACVRQIKSAVNLNVTIEQHVATVHHAYTHFKIRMEVFICPWRSGRVRLNGPSAFKWTSLGRLGDFPLHGAVHKALAQLKKYYYRKDNADLN